jgi:tetratricopeptide (TPR) repeat protein
LSLLISVDPMQAPVTQLELADRCIRLDPHYADCWQTRGMALRRMRRHAEAIAAFERCLEVSAAAHDCLRDLAISHVTTGGVREVRGGREEPDREAPEQVGRLRVPGRGADGAGPAAGAVRSALKQAQIRTAGGGAGVEGLEDELAVALATGRFSGGGGSRAEAREEEGCRGGGGAHTGPAWR